MSNFSLGDQFAEIIAPDRHDHHSLLKRLFDSARSGHLCLPLTEGEAPPVHPALHHWQDQLYLLRHWEVETTIVREVQRLLQMEGMEEALSLPSREMNEEQLSAAQLSLTRPFTLIAGGPGTGKSFVIGQIVRMAEESGDHVVVAAPTGKAASRLNIGASTLHSLLGIRSGRDLARGKRPLSADVVIVDEASMIDAELFASLLASIPDGCRLILVGDSEQLPPVGVGAPFADLLGVVPTALLTTPVRFDSPDIIELASQIRVGADITPFLSIGDPLEEALHHLPHPSVEWREAAAALDRFRILSPLREGPWGVNTLNRMLAESQRAKLRPGMTLPVPILIKKTDIELGLVNGDTGILLDRISTPRVAIFGEREIPEAELPPYEIAYVLSVHKSQGSEFDEVLFLIPKGSERFGREILYTGVTRAKKKIRLMGDPETVQALLKNGGRRRSSIAERLYARR
jgi:exodeoxyribonuclease V alpha subunit